jgi:hypothetical protein
MTMKFRDIKQALVDTLGAGAAGNFNVIGYQRQTKSSETINQNRLVQVYYSRGEFPKSGGRLIGPKNHDMTFVVEMTVSASAEADLATLNDAGSTALQRQTALANVRTAAEKADNEIDELIDLVYQILNDGQNLDLGLTKGTFGSRWVPSAQKDTTIEEGQFVVKTAQMQYTCKTDEAVTGETPTTPATITYDSQIDLDGDDVEKTGVTVENT